MNKTETQLEGMHSPVRPYLVKREDRVGCPGCNNRPGECQRHDMGVHNVYPPISVEVKFAIYFLSVLAAVGFFIWCAAKAVHP